MTWLASNSLPPPMASPNDTERLRIERHPQPQKLTETVGLSSPQNAQSPTCSAIPRYTKEQQLYWPVPLYREVPTRGQNLLNSRHPSSQFKILFFFFSPNHFTHFSWGRDSCAEDSLPPRPCSIRPLNNSFHLTETSSLGRVPFEQLARCCNARKQSGTRAHRLYPEGRNHVPDCFRAL